MATSISARGNCCSLLHAPTPSLQIRKALRITAIPLSFKHHSLNGPKMHRLSCTNAPQDLHLAGLSRGRGLVGMKAHFSFEVGAVAVENEGVTTTASGLQVVETCEPNSRVRLDIRVPPNVCKDLYDRVIRELSKKTQVPGFRQGKPVPEGILVNFVGRRKVKASAVESVLKTTLPEAMSSVAGRGVKESERIISKFTDLEDAFSPENSFSYVVTVDVVPEVKWISDRAYANLKVDVAIDPDSAYEEAAKAEFQSKWKDLGSLKIADDRGIKMGDVAILNISANRVNEDGTLGDRILSAEQKGFQLDTEDGANFLPGFVEALLGVKREETHSFDLTFPQTWQQEALRGVPARFTGHCREIFIRELPALDDSMAPKFLENCSTIDQVREQLLKKHKLLAEKTKKQATQLAITDALTKVAEIDVPNSLLEDQGRQMYGAKLMELQSVAKLSKEQVIGLSNEEMVKNFLGSQRQKIKDSVTQSVAVAEIFRVENLEYSEEELNLEVSDAVGEFRRYNQEYDIDRIREQAKELLEGSKVMDWLIEHAQVNFIIRE